VVWDNARRLRWAEGAILAVVVLLTLKHFAFPSAAAPRFLTAPAQMTDIEQTVLASGTIQPSKLVSVGAQASGRILALHVGLGDHVSKGQLIAEIDPSTQLNALQNAAAILAQERAQRTSREAALRQAELAFKRAATTYAQEASSQADYETAEATFHGTQADVAALDAQIREARISVDTAKVNLGFTKVVAPMDGTVVAIVAPEGQTVNAVQAAPTIVKLADLDTMTVKAQISEADVTQVYAGQKVYFTILGAPEHRYYATLRAVEPAPESIAAESTTTTGAGGGTGTTSSAVYYDGLFDIPNPGHSLRPSMTAQVNIVLREAKRVLTVPTSALREARRDGQTEIRVMDANGRVQPRRVRVGINNATSAQILEGLKVGERVVISETGSAGSRDGTERAPPPPGIS
jgi:membrane fusion protein, macrolide-specific efflux system